MTEDMPYPIGAALRRKMGWNLYHYGIASEYYHPETKKQLIYQFGGPYEGAVGENTKLKIVNAIWPTANEQSHTGVHIGLTPYDIFSENRKIEIVEVPENPVPVLKRAKRLMFRQDYNPALRNCEHYTNYALSGTWESNQSSELLGKAMQAAGMALLASVFKD
tara:strand:- start:424 stop:912 length:489 start_codon:yes stop_codon:yes gene_type:complete